MEYDFIQNGEAHGNVATRLLQFGMDPGALRPYIGDDGRAYITINVNGKPKAIPTANATLLYDEWKQIDDIVIPVAQERLVGIAHLQTRGLTFRIAKGMGKTVLASQVMGDFEPAQITMDGVTRGEKDRPEFDIGYLPLPIVHKDFSYSLREIEASRNGNQPLDTTTAELAARQLAEKLEEMLFRGVSSYKFGGGVLYGYMDFPHTKTGSLTHNWDDSAATGATIIADILAMKQGLIDKKRYGPYQLYVPTNFETALDENYVSNYPLTRRERILQIASINEMSVADKLTADNVLLIQMTSDTVRLVEGMAITTVQWEDEGGMRINFKVMAIMVPQIRADKENNCGVAHWS